MTMQGKVALVTGATNGIGEITAQALAQQGAEVVIVSRSPQKCADSVQKIKQATGNSAVSFIAGDLSLMSEVRRVAEQFKAQHSRLDVLVNNAGAFYDKRQQTSEGNEMTFALNHLNYFLLTHLLLDRLQATGEQTGDARVINVSSDAHQLGKINFEDIQRTRSYSGFRAYGESKLMNVMFSYTLANKLTGTPISVNALHPGFVRTGFGRNNGGIMNRIMGLIQTFALSPEQGAETSVYLASSPEVKGITGKYWSKKKAVKSSSASYDQSAQERLWRLSEQLTGLA